MQPNPYKLNFNLLNLLKVLVTDVLWFIPTLILGIVAAVRESQISSLDIAYQNTINTGAFASAAVIFLTRHNLHPFYASEV